MNFARIKPASIPIALVGVGALFPGSPQTGDFWRTIVRGIDRMGEVPPNYFLKEDYYDPDPSAPLKTYASRGGFIPKVPFDTLGNGIPPANVPMTDASQLLAMVVAKRVLEDACGLDLGRLDRARTAVILGVAGGSTLLGSMCSSLQRPIWTKALRESGLPEKQVEAICLAIEAHYTPWTESTFPGLLGNVIAGRVASRFDLGGANCTVDAACASSLAAIRMAAQELRLGTADLVVTGGVDATNDPMMFTCFSKTPALSRSGDCRPFSADSDGTMLGEGVGMFALRRLEDAERDGDHIYAVIRGLGASSDGRAKSIYAPRAEGQVKALRRAYEEAGYSPADVQLVEAHGTGTAAGDLAEVSALKTVFAEVGGDARNWCDLGSVKSQIGHTKSAAGAASLYKVAMALHHKVLPPTLKVSRPNPLLGLDESAFQLSTRARPWVHEAGKPRRAGVSSFGFGGSNYHMTVEEYVGPNRPLRIRALPTELFLVSAADAPSAVAAARAFLVAAEADDGFAPAACDSQRRFDPAAPVRLAFIVADAADLSAQIEEIAPRLAAGHPVRLPRAMAAFGQVAPGPVGFLFPGQGSQYVGMGADLATAFEAARAVWDEAASDRMAGFDTLHRLTFPGTAFEPEEAEAQAAALTATEAAQPAIGVTSQMMLVLLRAAGLRPVAAAGHSFGELTALFCAGVLDARDLRTLARRRGELMAETARATQGAMLAVFKSAAEIEAILSRLGHREVAFANYNAPDQIVLAGSVAAIDAAERDLVAAGLSCKRLPVATAFHSPIVAPAAPLFRAVLDTVPVQIPTVPVYGCATGERYGADAGDIRDRLARQLAEPVRFVEQVEAMHRAGVTTFIEVGPGATLSDLTGRILAGKPHRALAMDRRGRNGITQMWEMFGELSLAGYPLDLGFAWKSYATEAPAPVKQTAATLMIDGANYRKPYPPAGGWSALPAPNPEPDGHTQPEPALRTEPSAAAEPEPLPLADTTCDPTPQPAPIMAFATLSPATPEFSSPGDVMSSEADAARMSALIEALRLNAQSHVASQQAMAAAHLAYLRQTQELIGHLSGLPIRGLDLPDLTSTLRLATTDRIAETPPHSEPQPPFVFQQGIQPPLPAQPTPSAAPAPIAPEPVVAATIAMETTAPHPAPSSANPALAGTLLAIVAEKTGYPQEMLNPDMELEADLGIDSIKRVEILAALRAAVPDLPDVDPRDLAGLRTLSAILDRLGAVVSTPKPVVVPPVVAHSTAAEPASVLTTVSTSSPVPAGSSSALASTLLAIVAEKTGYPQEMLNPDMELEADLGIDSIKRVEILAALRAAVPDLPDVDPRDLASLRTLSAILDRLGAVSIVTPPMLVAAVAASPFVTQSRVAEPVSVPTTVSTPSPAQTGSSSALAGTLLAIVAEKTGYPQEMLNPEMELEADLGIDSIKRVEILAALRAAVPDLPDVDPRDLASLRTLSAILDRLGAVVSTPTPVVVPPVVAHFTAAEPASALTTVSTPSPAQAGSSSALAGTLLAIVAEKTGYPQEMLNPEMELEADLGIDSIKRVEILAALRAAVPDLPDVDPRDLAGLRTLSAILDRLGSAGIPEATTVSSALPRIGLRLVPVDRDYKSSLMPGMSIRIAGDGRGLAAPLSAALAEAGFRVVTQEQAGEATAVIALHGLEPAGDGESVARLHLEAFSAARQFAPKAMAQGGTFVTVQDTGGCFGLGAGAEASAWLGGMAGIAKTAATEWPLATVRAIDIDRTGLSEREIAARLVSELLTGGPLETGLPADGRRLTIAEATLAPAAGHGSGLPERPVLVVSGGARGVVAACLLALAPVVKPRLLLLGRTALTPEPPGLPQTGNPADLSRALYDIARHEGRQPSPRELSAEAAGIAAMREIRATISALNAAGAEARYVSVDVTDVPALETAFAQTRAAWGRIDGLVHGAGVLADKRIADQSDEQFLRVFRTKADGLSALLAATRQDALSRLVLFSSVAARYGNTGQVAYAAGNEVLNKVAQAEAARRGSACRVVSLNWGPWDGGMVTDGLREAFSRRGVPLIPLADGAQAFVAEMLAGAPAPVEIVIGGRLAGAPAIDKSETVRESAFA